MTLGQQQRIFTRNVGLLIGYAYRQGYELSLGEATRSKEQAALYAAAGIGTANSLHIDRLAIDLNLFRAGRYLVTTAAHKPLGDYWKGLHPLNRWGGDWAKSDGNHYSMEYRGRK
jgi:hypothetical protein